MKFVRLMIGWMAVLGLGFVRSGAAQSSPGLAGLPSDKTAEQVYANIKALTGVPYGEVIPDMQVMSEALGVECEHCHSESGDRDVEGNPYKDVARDMIRMVRDLNQRSFGGRNVISCYTCHRGSPQPVATLSLDRAQYPYGHGNAGSSDATPSLQRVLGKYVAALGSAEALRRNTSRVEEGSLVILGSRNQTVPIRSFSQAPDQRRTNGFTVSHLGDGPLAFGVVNGAQGWMRESNGPVRLMFGWRRDAAQLEDMLNLHHRIEQLLRDLRVERRDEVNGRDTVVLAGRSEFLPLVELYFDMESGLLSRIMYYVDSTAGRMPSCIDYSDYRDVDGVQVPFHWEVTLVRGVRVSYQLNGAKQNVPVDAAQFALPDPPPKLYR